LDDAGWDATVEARLPEDLPSGMYAVRLEGSGGAEDLLPLVVRPPRGQATAPVLFLIPWFSYLAYANLFWLRSSDAPLAPEDRYVRDNRLISLYDRHADDSGVCYASWRRPLVTMRPSYHQPALRQGLGSAHQLGADLHVIDWLHERGFEVDVASDMDLHTEGHDLLRRYRTVITGTHHEYWSLAMLDALEHYTDSGGRVMYMSGNGLYWVTALDEEQGHTIEIRRTVSSQAESWYHAPGEGTLSVSGEEGGLWRMRGRAPQRYVGVGNSAQNSGVRGVAYHPRAASRDPRAAFIFEGIDPDAPIGAFPNLVSTWGAAGFELDRADARLGTPPHALVLATSDSLGGPPTEELWRPNPTADLVFFETGGGGAVFSVGSIAWCGGLSHNGYDNDVAHITENVLRRFISAEPFAFPLP
ncbi:MAG: hypothetical protein QOD77_2293, partial [Thermoplasmata archaeon]|nr:hypothetical protein [Thermoplasmata archaeon]